MLHYFRCSEGVSCSTSFHMCDNWYFSRFLLRDGSFMQMYMASFMVLLTPCDSLSAMVKHSKLTGCPLISQLMDREWGCKMLLQSVPKSPPRFPYVFLWAIPVRALKPGILPHFFDIFCPGPLGAMSKVQMVLLFLRCTFMSKLLHVFFNLSLSLFCEVLQWKYFCCWT